MRLAFVEAAGFRGFRERVRIDCARGFTIISGRNGVGKTTIFDAIEFCLTGKLSKYEGETAANQTIANYVWWIGHEPDLQYYVKLGFENDDGETFEVQRTRGGLEEGDDQKLQRLIGPDAPDRPLELLCNTSIIRDELIAKSSLELAEAERFRFVSSALGSLQFQKVVERARAVERAAQHSAGETEREYGDLRERVNRLVEELARARDSSTRPADVAAATALLIRDFDLPNEQPINASAVRASLVQRQRDVRALQEIVASASSILPTLSSVNSPAFGEELLRASKTYEAQQNQLEDATRALDRAQEMLLSEQEANEMASALSSILTLGHRVGLVDGHCPLCDSQLNAAQFESGMAAAEKRLGKRSKSVAAAQAAVNTSKARTTALSSEVRRSQEAIERLRKRRDDAIKAEQSLLSQLRELDVDIKELDVDALETRLNTMQSQSFELERALGVVEIAERVGGLPELEARLDEARKSADVAAESQSRAARAVRSAVELRQAAVRVSNEILEERLVQLSPLLSELYQRLRPHPDWREIEYRIRGDVRRFLSLSVGEELNPQFVFSSGQRRIVGLAFLFALYLSRSWVNWDSLLLDDPVQHIDDYRALNLVEVLAAIRRDGRQVICAVEDSALAELIARRLSDTNVAAGVSYTLDIGSRGVTEIKDRREVQPILAGVFLEA